MAEKKYPPIEVLKETLGEGVEVPEELLADIAGGAYTEEEWFAMSEEERKAAQNRSTLLIGLGRADICELSPGVDPDSVL